MSELKVWSDDKRSPEHMVRDVADHLLSCSGSTVPMPGAECGQHARTLMEAHFRIKEACRAMPPAVRAAVEEMKEESLTNGEPTWGWIAALISRLEGAYTNE